MAQYTTKRLKELENRVFELDEENSALKRENKNKKEELDFFQRAQAQTESSTRCNLIECLIPILIPNRS